MASVAALLAIAALTGCREPALDDLWKLSDDGILVLVDREPYRVSVWVDGELVLQTLGAGDGSGFGSVGHATGTVSWGSEVSPGWTRFDANLSSWRDDWVVVAAAEDSEDRELELTLVSPEDAADWQADTGGLAVPAVVVTHSVEPSVLRVRARLVGDDAPRAWSVGFSSPEEEGFLGLGERFNRTDQRGVDVYSWAEEGGVGLGEGALAGPENPSPNGEAMTYYPVPFTVSTQGYGFWLDTTYRSELALATEREDAWRAWHIGPELAYEVYTPLVDDDRPWPYHAIDLFTGRTGRPALPPAWAFGPRRRVGRTSTVDGVDEILAMREADLAITAVDDAVHFLPAGSHVGIEPELAAWTARAKGLGYRVNAYYNPYLENREDNPLWPYVQEGLANDWFLLDGEGEPSEVWLISGDLVFVVAIDFTVGDAAEWYQGMFQWAIDAGYNGFMYDFGEYVQPDVVSGAGLTGDELHNLYPVLYQRAAALDLQQSELADE